VIVMFAIIEVIQGRRLTSTVDSKHVEGA
jgi:hypothetical protein